MCLLVVSNNPSPQHPTNASTNRRLLVVLVVLPLLVLLWSLFLWDNGRSSSSSSPFLKLGRKKTLTRTNRDISEVNSEERGWKVVNVDDRTTSQRKDDDEDDKTKRNPFDNSNDNSNNKYMYDEHEHAAKRQAADQDMAVREAAILETVNARVASLWSGQERESLLSSSSAAAAAAAAPPKRRRLQESSWKLKSNYTFAVVPKQLIEFFEPTGLGCKDHAFRLSGSLSEESGQDVSIHCLYVGPTDAATRAEVQAIMVEELLFGANATITKIDGMAISVVNETLMTPIMDRAITELGIPIVTFDSDAPESLRSYYIGTNNSFFGRQLARQMESLIPTGGTFGIIAGESTNLQERASGILKELQDQQSSSSQSSTPNHHNNYHKWQQFPDSPFDAQNNLTLALEKLNQWSLQNPQVLLSVTGLPMRIMETIDQDTNTTTSYAPWQDFVDLHRHRNITLLCADASPHQLKFLEYNYINGLAGQLPYDMGIKSIDTLWTLLHQPDANLGDAPDGDFIGTNVLWHVHIPLNLPPIQVDRNRIGGLRYVGFTLFGMVAATSLAFIVWAYIRRNVRVVKVAQPKFLAMIAVGVLIMASCMIPAGMDDLDYAGFYCSSEDLELRGHNCQTICMSIPWLSIVGFTLTFSAMYSKTYRVNKIFKADTNFARMRVKEKDVLLPFFVLLFINISILLCWTLLDPLTYRRQADFARDEWNRVISTYGGCKSEHVVYYLTPLILVNFGVLIMANWQAYQARELEGTYLLEWSIVLYCTVYCVGSSNAKPCSPR